MFVAARALRQAPLQVLRAVLHAFAIVLMSLIV